MEATQDLTTARLITPHRNLCVGKERLNYSLSNHVSCQPLLMKTSLADTAGSKTEFNALPI